MPINANNAALLRVMIEIIRPQLADGIRMKPIRTCYTTTSGVGADSTAAVG